MTPEQLDRLKEVEEREAKATAGPWETIPPAKTGKHWEVGVRGELNGKSIVYLIASIDNGAPGDTLETERANAELFANAKDDARFLLSLVRELRAKVEGLNAAITQAGFGVLKDNRGYTLHDVSPEAKAAQAADDVLINENIELEKRMMEADERIGKLEELVSHCWVHSGYQNCGYSQMDSEMRELYDEIVRRPVEGDAATKQGDGP